MNGHTVDSYNMYTATVRPRERSLYQKWLWFIIVWFIYLFQACWIWLYLHADKLVPSLTKHFGDASDSGLDVGNLWVGPIGKHMGRLHGNNLFTDK
jgi:hypothetical protein